MTDVEFGNPKSLEEAIQRHPNVCAFVLEPILGEAGVWVPKEGYLKEVRLRLGPWSGQSNNHDFVCDRVKSIRLFVGLRRCDGSAPRTKSS